MCVCVTVWPSRRESLRKMQLKVFRYSLLSSMTHSGIVWKAERGTLNRGWMRRFVELDGDEVCARVVCGARAPARPALCDTCAHCVGTQLRYYKNADAILNAQQALMCARELAKAFPSSTPDGIERVRRAAMSVAPCVRARLMARAPRSLLKRSWQKKSGASRCSRR